MKMSTCDVLVVGSGIAGLYTALKLSDQAHVFLVTKSELKDSNSSKAQGGIAVAVDEEDSPQKHFQDTIVCGVGLSDPLAVRLITEKSKDILKDLITMGVLFDQTQDQRLALGKEGFHSMSRIVHAGGDSTGKVMVDTLVRKVKDQKNITIWEHAFVENLITVENICYGAVFFHKGTHIAVRSQAVVLANGGGGQLYTETTNVLPITGDGFALAYRAGAELADMEFVQFHPTALATDDHPKPLISEAVRGAGAVLVDERGRAFMQDYHSWGDLAPRDVVSRAIFEEMNQGRTVYLDVTAIGQGFPERFPQIYRSCIERGIDPVREWIPVTPAVHFMMGGVQTDLEGKTSVAGLYACGETACTGVHGANRLASNSLLEGFVFGAQIAQSIKTEKSKAEFLQLEDASSYRGNLKHLQVKYTAAHYVRSELDILAHPNTHKLKEHMWQYAGIVRHEQGLTHLLIQLERWQQTWAKEHPVWENMCTTATAIVQAALSRTESRGGHYRSDYPETENRWEHKRTHWRKGHEHHLVT